MWLRACDDDSKENSQNKQWGEQVEKNMNFAYYST